MNQFDEVWYLERYPDVRESSISPYQHYIKFGKKEGRLPFFIKSVDIDCRLWSQSNHSARIYDLENVLLYESESVELSFAAWSLARWYGSNGEWIQARVYINKMLENDIIFDVIGCQGPFLLAFSIYFNLQEHQLAKSLLDDERWVYSEDKALAKSMLHFGSDKLEQINKVFENHNLALINTNSGNSLDLISAYARSNHRYFDPLVTVIIPCYNAEKTISTALKSLLNQSYQKLEILVADDASTDTSREVVQQFSERDRRIRLLSMPENSGAYAARNAALRVSKGSLITTHDADDWSHPDKIRLQVAVLIWNPKAAASVSHWVRTTPDLSFQRWRMEEGWVYRNVSSLMFKRKVFRKLGFWDRVSVNADTEYYHRIRKVFGDKSILEVKPGVPLAFGRADESSLSQTKATHLRTQFKGVRKDYHDAAIQWHNSSKRLFMPEKPSKRPFAVPFLICRGTQRAKESNLALRLKDSGLFDAEWYLSRYKDVRLAKANPFNHFIRFGLTEGRDPSAICSVTGLAFKLNVSLWESIERFIDAPQQLKSPIGIAGSKSRIAAKPTLLMVGHQVTDELFGAERSFLDVIEVLSQQKLNIIVTLPSASNKSYIEKIVPLVSSVIILPYGWWEKNKQACSATVDQFKQLMIRHAIKQVYINTLVLGEAAIAARELDLTTTVHVRELLEYDPDLCEVLGTTHTDVRNSLHATGCRLIANSNAVAKWLQPSSSATVIPNTIHINDYPLAPMNFDSEIKIVVLSSNLPKKGIDDVIAVAERLKKLNINVAFKLYGPINEYVVNWKKQGLPSNLLFCGYAESSWQGISDAHIVLNLSHFQESFGRTVLEAMACGRAVVAYDWGAVSEVIDESCGIVVEYKNIEHVVAAIMKLSADTTSIVEMGQQGRRRAATYFNKKVVAEKFMSHFNF
ncbi:glycosyltransferase [Alteromonas lipotrueiana]|uniref:glycosyltransferase n=1 Tax=Alteromonas lipotrueiana TaxID=2803815 RepID=UPI001C441223|nr:glycosyltransferase [Alteromonas lipotrueiana]